MSLDTTYVRKASRKLRKLLRKDRKSLAPEKVHEIRTMIRRIEAAAEAILVSPKARDRAALKQAARIRKRAGKVRDMDVLTMAALSLHVPSGEREELMELMQHLGARRHKEAKRLRAVMRKTRAGFENDLKWLCVRIETEVERGTKAQGAPPEALGTAVRLFTDLKRPARLTAGNLHPYRLKVKKLRDVIRFSEEARNTPLVSVLGEVKDAIGEWHDWGELQAIAEKVLNGGSRSLLKRLKRVGDQKYRHSASLAERMRQNFLNENSKRVPKSMIQTTAAIAS